MKIGLIAMSGIRVCDAELLEMGLTLPGFVERSKVIASLPSLGLLTLAGMLPNHHTAEYIEIRDLNETKKNDDIPGDFDMVAISSYSAQINEAYELGDIYRARGVPVVLGGLHVSTVPEEAKPHCDAVVVGEGESSWLELLSDLEKNRLKPIYGSLDEEFDLSDAPMPSFELLDIDKYNRLTVQTSRGCPRRCEFCASSILITAKYKQKPADKVLAEIDRIRDIWPRPFIEFADDNTFVNFSYWRDLLPKLISRKFRWFTETDISIARHPKLLRQLRAAGCVQLLIGFESPIQSALDGLETRSNWKIKQWSEYKKAVTTIQSFGISVNGCFILGLDGQRPDVFNRLFEYVDDLKLHEVQITIQTAFPGTPLYNRLHAEQRITEQKAWHKLTLFDINYAPSDMTAIELKTGFHQLAEQIYSDDFTSLRRERFKGFLKNSLRKTDGRIF